jgi:spore maturation protein CgeB
MNILFYKYKGFPVSIYIDVLKRLGHNVEILLNPFEDHNQWNEQLTEKMLKAIKDNAIDVVFSMNFFSFISNVCDSQNVTYIGWVHDKPLRDLYSKEAFNKCNRIFIFDKSQYLEFKAVGLKHIYHLPLSADVLRWDNIKISVEDIGKYQCEVSFVGNLYENNPYNQLRTLPSYVRGYVDGLIAMQLNIMGYNLIDHSMNDFFVKQFKNYANYSTPENVTIPDERYISQYYISRKCTEVERVRTLNAISNICRLSVFSASDLSEIPNIIEKGYVDYIEEMPKVFKLSKINLNMSLRSITTGIPQRVFDIMAAGGFVISNYQLEIEELFEIGKEIVVYDTLKDLKEKIRYYLEHEEEREQIAYNGYLKVKNTHSLDNKLKDMLNQI